MQHNKRNWKNLPSHDTPIDAESLNSIEDALYDLTYEESTGVEPNSPWQGGIILKRRGNRVNMSATLMGGNPWDVDNAIIFHVPESFRPREFVIVTAYTGGAAIPLQYVSNSSMSVFYLNTKLATKPEEATDIVFNTFYFID